jgi:hypothetical protein
MIHRHHCKIGILLSSNEIGILSNVPFTFCSCVSDQSIAPIFITQLWLDYLNEIFLLIDELNSIFHILDELRQDEEECRE